MPISEKIIKEIEKTDANSELKDLMMDILELEDNGAKRWKKQYDKMIKDYINEDEEMTIK